MKILAKFAPIASASMLAACGGSVGNVPDAPPPAIQLASSVTTVVTADTAVPPPSQPAPMARQAAQRLPAARPHMSPTLDGLWLCRADDGQGGTLKLDIAGNAMRDVVSQQTMALARGKGIELGIRLLDYRDKDSGELTHARKLQLVDKPGFASFFTASANAGAGMGAELSLNPNDTLKISDYSSMRGTETVGQVVLMTCSRQRELAGA